MSDGSKPKLSKYNRNKIWSMSQEDRQKLKE